MRRAASVSELALRLGQSECLNWPLLQAMLNFLVESGRRMMRLGQRYRRYLLATFLVATISLMAAWIFLTDHGCTECIRCHKHASGLIRHVLSAGENLIAFDVPRQHIPQILAELSPAIRDDAPMKWQVIGRLELRCTWGRHVTIDLFRPQTGLGAFRVGNRHHVYYRGGSAARFERAIKGAYSTGTAR